MSLQIYQLLREFFVGENETAWEAMDPNGDRVTIWPGSPDRIQNGAHPLLPNTVGSGRMDDQTVWIEHRPGALVLGDIMDRASVADGIEWMAQICDAVSALHSVGRIHGNIQSQSVVLNENGTPFLIGSGQHPGNVEDDLNGLVSLAKKLAPLASLLPDEGSAAAIGARLREAMSNIEERTPIQLPTAANQQPIGTASIEIIHAGSMDEIRIDMGVDPEEPGLLDRWNHYTNESECTEDATESADRSLLQTNNPETLAAAIDHQIGELIEHFDNQGISPSEDFRQLILTAPTDPLPIPEGLPHGKLHNPEGDAERTAEVPTHDGLEPVTAHDETTGITNTAAIPPLFMTGLLTAAITGMLGAIIMLLLVWLVIDGAF